MKPNELHEKVVAVLHKGGSLLDVVNSVLKEAETVAGTVYAKAEDIENPDSYTAGRRDAALEITAAIHALISEHAA